MATRRSITQVSAWVDPPLAGRLARLARQNERSVSAEARLAIRRHLAEAEPKTAERETTAA